jgi:hypothetical protein
MTARLCRALNVGLSNHLPPVTLAALQCTSAELDATIRDCDLWRKLTVRLSACYELNRHGRHFIDGKGVQQVFVDEDELDFEFIDSLVNLQATTRRQLQFTGRVERVALGSVALYDPATDYSDFAAERKALNIATGSFTAEFVKALEFVGRHFPDALVVIEGFTSLTMYPIDVDVKVDTRTSTSLPAVLRAIDTVLHTCGLKRVRVGSYSNFARYSHSHDWSLAPYMDSELGEEEQRPDEAEDTVYECSSGLCKQVEGATASGRHFVAAVGPLTESLEIWFDHTWHEWSVGEGGPPNRLHA